LALKLQAPVNRPEESIQGRKSLRADGKMMLFQVVITEPDIIPFQALVTETEPVASPHFLTLTNMIAVLFDQLK
jgi:hypothetical protein